MMQIYRILRFLFNKNTRRQIKLPTIRAYTISMFNMYLINAL